MNKIINNGSLILIPVSMFSVFTCIWNFSNIPDGYRLMSVFPIIYLFFASWSLKYLANSYYMVTGLMYLGIQGIRFLIMPPVIALAGNKCGTSYIHVSASDLNISTILMLMEFIICTFLLTVFCSRKKINIEDERTVSMLGEKFTYIVFVMIAMMLCVLYRDKNLFSFFVIRSGTEERIGDLTNTTLVLIRQIVLVAIMIVFVYTIHVCRKKYELSGKKIYYIIPLFVGIMSICVIVGERRTTQIYTAFCCMICLSLAFPAERKKTIKILFVAAALVLILMSIYKVSYAFLYDSYLEALSSTSFSFSGIATTLQAYFSGPQNIAVGLAFARENNITVFNFIFDIFRCTVPFNLFVKDLGTLTSSMFNSFIYSSDVASGHLLSSSCYGFMCFSPIFFWLVMWINLSLSMFCEKKMRTARSLEFVYIWGYLLMRLSFGVTINTPVLLNSASILLITGGLLFKVSNVIGGNIRRIRGGLAV